MIPTKSFIPFLRYILVLLSSANAKIVPFVNTSINNNIFSVIENFGIPCESSLFIFENVGVSEAFIVPAMATMTGSILQSTLIWSMNNLTSDLLNTKKVFPNPARNYKSELGKCSFIFVNQERNMKWESFRSLQWFISCFQSHKCFHFSIIRNSIRTNPTSLYNIFSSVNTEAELLGQNSPIHHIVFITEDNEKHFVCSSRSNSSLRIKRNDGDPISFYCQNEFNPLRISFLRYSQVNFIEIYDWFRSKSREIFLSTAVIELFWQMELAIKLNISIKTNFKMYAEQIAQDLKSNEADIGIAISFNHKYSQIVGHSSSAVGLDKMIFFIGLPKPKPTTIAFIVKPFNYILWLSILGQIIFTSILTRFFTRPFGTESTFIGHVKLLVLPLLDQSQNLHVSYLRISGIKFIIGQWLLSSIVLSTTYKSRLVSELVTPEMEMPPRTFQTLLGSPNKYELFHPGYSNLSDLHKSLESSGTHLAKTLRERIKPIVTDTLGVGIFYLYKFIDSEGLV
jgi:hypothetical protein